MIERIVRSINPKPDDAIVEIGLGLGAITEEILAINPRLQELDRDLIPVLRTKFFNYPEFQIHEADALSFDFRELMTDRPLRIVGNLPYNISTPLIFHLLEQSGVVQDMHFMLQKEVVQRLAAVPGDNNYGRLGIMAQYFCKQQPPRSRPRRFPPGPKVDRHCPAGAPQRTAAPGERPENPADRGAYCLQCPSQNPAQGAGGDGTVEQLQSLGINDGLRPENLSLADYVKIADLLVDSELRRPGTAR